MTAKEFTNTDNSKNERKLSTSLMRGFRGRCPSCGISRLFVGGLKVQDKCSSCHEEFHHHRADDLPAYLNIFLIGHVVVAMSMILMDMKVFEMWTLVILACVTALVMAVALMRPLKGMVVGMQWALRMHGFGGHDD